MKQFATTVRSYHTNGLATISNIARDKQLTLTNRLNQRRMKNINLYRKIRPAKLADEYLRLIDQTLNQEIKNLVKYGPVAQDPYIKSWARRRLGDMELQRKRAAELRASLPAS